MILKLLQGLFPLIVLVVLCIPIYAIFFGIKELRNSLMPSDIGFKAAPFGCATSILAGVVSIALISLLPRSLNFLFLGFFALSVTAGIIVIRRMSIFFFNKAKAAQLAHPETQYPSLPEYDDKPRFGCGILLFIAGGVVITPLSCILFHIWVLPFLVIQCHLYYDLEKIPLRDLPEVDATISLTDYPIGFIPGNESAFVLVVEGKNGNVLHFPHFIINCGSHYELPVHHIAGKTTEDHGWLQFSNDGQLQYLNLNSLKLTDELPEDLENAPRKFIGVYERGKLDTNAKDLMSGAENLN